jgi:hypothetical protein
MSGVVCAAAGRRIAASVKAAVLRNMNGVSNHPSRGTGGREAVLRPSSSETLSR